MPPRTIQRSAQDPPLRVGVLAVTDWHAPCLVFHEMTPARLRLAELTSAVGAGVLGFGIGTWVGSASKMVTLFTMVVGGVMHAWGMSDKHALDKRAGLQSPRWAVWLYWLCWLALAGLGVRIVIEA